MPSWLMSSSLPTNGLTYAAPVLATSSAWLGEKHSVILILIPCPLRHLHAFTPSRVVGSFTTTCSCQLANSWPSRHIVPESVPTTSTLTGPPTILQISRIAGLNGLPSLAMSDGLVVTPSRIPGAAAARISFIFPVSRKIFIPLPSLHFVLKKCCHPERGRALKRFLQLGKPESKDLGFVFPMTRCPDRPISR